MSIEQVKSGHAEIGLFPVNYRITTGVPGAPLLRTQLLVSTPDQRVTGFGQITQTTNPPLDIRARLNGDYGYLAFEGGSRIMMNLKGFPVSTLPPGSGVGPVLLENIGGNLLLSSDFRSGSASFWYLDNAGIKHTIEGATVEFEEVRTIS